MAAWVLLALAPVAAGVMFGFASYYGHHMVLQKEPVGAVVWGYGEPGATVTVVLSGDGGLIVMKKMARVKGPSGTWTTVLDPMDQGGPYTLMAGQGSENVTLRDIYFGDVWLCSGQSNMVMTVLQIANASQELADATRYPYVRIFAAAPARSNVELEDLEHVELPWSIPTAACCFLTRKPGPWEFHPLLSRLLAVGALPLRGSGVPHRAGGGSLGGHPHRSLVLQKGSAGLWAPGGRREHLPAPASLRPANALRALERHDPPAAQHDSAGCRLVPGRGQYPPAHRPLQLHLPRARGRLALGFPRRIGRADTATPPLRLRAVVHLPPAEPGRQLCPSPLAPNSRSGGCPQRQAAQHLHGGGDGPVR